MHQKVLDYIKELTKRDSKTLSQKGLKGAEELGELAKLILPFENAAATTHRFVTRMRLLEEAVDTITVMLSIAYELGFSDDEIGQMMDRKTTKWANRLAREGRIKYPIPYEIHVTVAASQSVETEEEVKLFKGFCDVLGVKPILLDLHTRGGPIKDLMTSSVFRGDNKGALAEVKRISEQLTNCGYKVLREKIETIPWHPAAPSKEDETPTMPPGCYFECHLNVVCTEDRRKALEMHANTHGAKMSRNVFKKISGETFTIMVTYRSYDAIYEDFSEKVEKLKASLAKYGFEFEKEIVEFSLYDTRVSHDAKWMLEG